MSRWILTLVLVAVLSSPAGGADFSLYGAKFGMPRQELRGLWTPLESGEYKIKDAPVFGVTPEFDHLDRLYKITFSLVLGDKYPFTLASAAFQRLVNNLWGRNPDLLVSVRAGRDSVETTVTSKRLMEEYYSAIEAQLSILLRP